MSAADRCECGHAWSDHKSGNGRCTVEVHHAPTHDDRPCSCTRFSTTRTPMPAAGNADRCDNCDHRREFHRDRREGIVHDTAAACSFKHKNEAGYVFGCECSEFRS